MLIVLNKKEFVLPLMIPGLNYETMIPFCIYTIVHGMLTSNCVCGMMLSDSLFATFIINSYVLVEFFKIYINDLNLLLLKNHNDNECLEIKRQLRLIVNEYNDILT